MEKYSDFIFMPLEEVSEPINGYLLCLKDKYWMVHPEKGLAFYSPKNRHGKRPRGLSSPQCNSDSIVTNKMSKRYAWSKVRYIPLVFIHSARLQERSESE